MNLEKLRNELKSLHGLKLLIIFGSIAEGVERISSDVDIIVECDDISMENLLHILSREFNGRELHVFKARWFKPHALLHIARKGIVIVDRGVLTEVMSKIPCDYFELREYMSDFVDSWIRGNSIDIQLIMRMTSQIDEDFRLLEELLSEVEEVLKDPIKRRAFERALHTAIEGMFDILRHIASRIAPGSFETYRELVEVAERLGIVSSKTSKIMNELVDVRHTLVHRYRGIRDEFLKESLHKAFIVWKSFRDEIKSYLSRFVSPDVT